MIVHPTVEYYMKKGLVIRPIYAVDFAGMFSIQSSKLTTFQNSKSRMGKLNLTFDLSTNHSHSVTYELRIGGFFSFKLERSFTQEVFTFSR